MKPARKEDSGTSPEGRGAPRSYSFILPASALMLALYLTSLYSYNLFHSLAELFSVAVAWGIFMIAWNSRGMAKNNYLLFLGVSYLFVGVIDLLHTLAYKGMGVFHGFDANLPTQLWIAGRYMQSLSFFLAPMYIGRRLNYKTAVFGYTLISLLLLLSIFLNLFPVCYVEGIGLTPFKKISEYIIISILAISATLLYGKRDFFDADVLKLIAFSILLTGLSELMFTLYISVYGISNLIGHFLKVFAFYLIYKAIIVTGIVNPYNIIFRELRQRTVQLEAANTELESFSYSASHDLKAPIRTIQGFSKALLEDCPDKLDDTGRGHLARIHSASMRMSELIDQLLMLSKVSRSELQRESLDLGMLARSIVEDLREDQPEHKAEFVIAEGLTAYADKRLMEVALENLLGNARKFSGKKYDARIEFAATAINGETVFFVRDNGVGFDMAYAEKLFLPFQRLHAASEFPGSGIGLATVQRIIGLHGGRIWADGAPGRGATFYFTLPDRGAS